MNVHDWLTGAAILLMAAIVGWTVYQNVMLKKDVTILSTIKEVEALWEAVNNILKELGVDTLDDALQEIGVLKGTVPTPKDSDGASVMFKGDDGEMRWDDKKGSFWIPNVKPAEKK